MRLRVAIVHTDLGLGGAERFMVDSAVWLQDAGHTVTIFATGHDADRCFEPTRNGKLDVRVHGSFLPRQIFGRLRAPCTIARLVALSAAVAPRRGEFDVILCDLVAQAIPLVRASLGAKVVFYCHYPDLLLAPHGTGLYRLYRWPLDALEAAGMRRAELVLVNSRFTRAAFEGAFPRLKAKPEVLHPGVDCALYESVPAIVDADRIVLLSISRFEAPKKLHLAVEALGELGGLLPSEIFARVRLVLAGGYDARLAESSATVDSLRTLAERLGVADRVELVLNPSDRERENLLAGCRCLVYTPPREHFGLVPLEAMASGRPVIAVNAGGPVETIVDGQTGFLCAGAKEPFARAAARLIGDVGLARAMGSAGREHVREKFSLERAGRELEGVLVRVVRG